MADLNHVTLIGRLTRDADLKYTASGYAVSKFSIAVNRSVKRGDNWETDVSFFEIVLWGKKAESLNKYLLKGKQIGVDGELRQERWQQDGQNRSKVEVVANNVQLLGGGNQNSEGGNGNQSGGAKPQSSRPPTQSYERHNDDGFTDDVPF